MKVYIMVGIIGSGKSTFAKKIAKENPNTVIICRDSLRTMFAGYYEFPANEDLVHAATRSLIKIAIERGHDIIIDECHLTPRHRKEEVKNLKRLVDPYSLEVIIVHCKSKIGNVERRMNEARGMTSEEWQEVYDRMNKNFVPPTIEELEGMNGEIIVHDIEEEL